MRPADRWGGAGRQFTLTPVDKPILPDKVGWLHNEILETPVAHGYTPATSADAERVRALVRARWPLS